MLKFMRTSSATNVEWTLLKAGVTTVWSALITIRASPVIGVRNIITH